MVNILRVTTRWSNFSGSPGFTVLHFRDFDTQADPTAAQATAAVSKVRDFFAQMENLIPAGILLTVNQSVEVIEDTTGELVNVVQSTAPSNTATGTATGTTAGPAGAVINWRTNSIRNGRRIRGRTFLVPLASSAYESNGTLTAVAQANIQARADSLAASTGSPDLGVYARPSGPGATDGQWVVSTGATVPDLVAVLRSRRD